MGSPADRITLWQLALGELFKAAKEEVELHLGKDAARTAILSPVVVAQLITSANSVCMGWEQNHLRWEPGQPLGGPPYYRDGNAPDDDSINF
jgi:hypothetical protein